MASVEEKAERSRIAYEAMIARRESGKKLRRHRKSKRNSRGAGRPKGSGTGTKRVHVNVRLPFDMIYWLKENSRRTGVSQGKLIEEGIHRMIRDGI